MLCLPAKASTPRAPNGSPGGVNAGRMTWSRCTPVWFRGRPQPLAGHTQPDPVRFESCRHRVGGRGGTAPRDERRELYAGFPRCRTEAQFAGEGMCGDQVWFGVSVCATPVIRLCCRLGYTSECLNREPPTRAAHPTPPAQGPVVRCCAVLPWFRAKRNGGALNPEYQPPRADVLFSVCTCGAGGAPGAGGSYPGQREGCVWARGGEGADLSAPKPPRLPPPFAWLVPSSHPGVTAPLTTHFSPRGRGAGAQWWLSGGKHPQGV